MPAETLVHFVPNMSWVAKFGGGADPQPDGSQRKRTAQMPHLELIFGNVALAGIRRDGPHADELQVAIDQSSRLSKSELLFHRGGSLAFLNSCLVHREEAEVARASFQPLRQMAVNQHSNIGDFLHLCWPGREVHLRG